MRRVAEELLQKANGRKLAVVGAGTFTAVNMRLIAELGVEISFFVDSDYDHRKYFEYQTGYKVLPYHVLDRTKHYAFVFQITDHVIYSMVSDLEKMGFGQDDYSLWTELSDRDLICGNMTVGKRVSSYDAILGWSPLVKSIGHYSSINRTAQVVADHNVHQLTIASCLSLAPKAAANRLSIGNDVWIGANAVINASRVKSIGDGAIIGTGAVVIQDVPPYAIVVGVPGRVKKYRFTPDETEILERVKWWNWNKDQIKANADCFADINVFFDKFRFTEQRYQIVNEKEFTNGTDQQNL